MNDNIKNQNNNGNHSEPETYKFKVRENTYETEKKNISGREVCEMAGLIPPENYKLDLKSKGNQYQEIKPDTIVDLSEPGIEKFTYITRDQSEG
ncbi:MAG: multiubiquitin domain-containing protein [Anaerotignum sp.]|nr:multiubiquitin domain-containing protein [Anaerotignum sp.]